MSPLHRVAPAFRLAGFARRLRASERGVSLIEFALSLPILLSLGFGGLEVANLALTHLRVSQIASTVADNAGRVTTRIDENDINEIFAGAVEIGRSINFQDTGRIVLSSLQDNGKKAPDHGQMINWQRCRGGLDVDSAYGPEGTGRNNGNFQGMGPNPAGPEDHRIQSLPGTAVMFVEVTYTYRPLLRGILSPRTIHYESAFNVRERTEQDITNTQALAVNGC